MIMSQTIPQSISETKLWIRFFIISDFVLVLTYFMFELKNAGCLLGANGTLCDNMIAWFKWVFHLNFSERMQFPGKYASLVQQLEPLSGDRKFSGSIHHAKIRYQMVLTGTLHEAGHLGYEIRIARHGFSVNCLSGVSMLNFITVAQPDQYNQPHTCDGAS